MSESYCRRQRKSDLGVMQQRITVKSLRAKIPASDDVDHGRWTYTAMLRETQRSPCCYICIVIFSASLPVMVEGHLGREHSAGRATGDKPGASRPQTRCLPRSSSLVKRGEIGDRVRNKGTGRCVRTVALFLRAWENKPTDWP